MFVFVGSRKPNTPTFSLERYNYNLVVQVLPQAVQRSGQVDVLPQPESIGR
jgi:hypothetical protein